MWPFKSKRSEADVMWDTLSGKVDPDLLEKALNKLQEGDEVTAATMFEKYLKSNCDKIQREQNEVNLKN